MKIIKKTVTVILAMLTVFLFLFGDSALAAKKPYMKSSNVRWNLKPDKTVTFKAYYSGYGYVDIKATVKDFVIEDADEEGCKEMRFYIDYKLPKLKLTKKQIQKIFDAGNQLNYMWTILDYDTGTSMEVDNDLDVSISYEPWEYSESKYIYSLDSKTRVGYPRSAKKEVSVIYPEELDSMCLMVGGSSDPYYDGEDFWNGELPFKKTPFYKKNKPELSSFMRIKDME